MLLTWILTLLAMLPEPQYTPYDLNLAFNWGPIIGAASSIITGLLQKKGADKQADMAGQALTSSNQARTQALGQLSNEQINAILAQFFPGLMGGGFGGVVSSSPARSAPTWTDPWSAAAMRLLPATTAVAQH